MDFGKTKREYRGSICTKSQQSKKLESAFKTPTKGGAPQASRCIIAKYLENVNRCSKAVDENESVSYDAAREDMLCTQKEDCSLSRTPNGYGWESSCSTNETVL